ncbi:hypothetical protein F4776DRAFT_324762 [Hypoxylon sp. NC0597]|nr:hypothetical protein F4776DRAFT_324762 [Hypoxylon sp. NC0597]
MVLPDLPPEPVYFSSDAQYTAEQSVNMSELQITPRNEDQVRSPAANKFTLPPAFLESGSANATQGPSSAPAQSQPATQDEEDGEGAGVETEGNKNEKEKDNDKSTLDEFWYEQSSWDVQLSAQDKLGKKKGLGGCKTGPDCYVCGTKLSLRETLGYSPCSVCYSFN